MLKFYDFKILKFSVFFLTENLKIPKSQNLKIPKSRNPKISNSENRKIGPKNRKFGPMVPLTGAARPGLSARTEISDLGKIPKSQNLKIPKSQNLKISKFVRKVENLDRNPRNGARTGAADWGRESWAERQDRNFRSRH